MRLIRLLKEDIAREAADWVSNDIITTVQAEKICEQYDVDFHEAQNRSLGYKVLVGLGYLFIGLAVITLLGANWDDIPRALRMWGLIGTTMLIQGFALWKYASGAVNSAVGIFFLGNLFYGASIVLIAQIYHLGEHMPDGIFWWALGCFPIGILINSPLITLQSLMLALIWFFVEVDMGFYPAMFPLFLAGTLVVLFRGKPSIVLFLTLIASMGLWIEYTLAHLWGGPRHFTFQAEHVSVSVALLIFSYSVSLWLSQRESGIAKDYGVVLAVWSLRFGLLFMLVMSFEEPWRELLKADWSERILMFGIIAVLSIGSFVSAFLGKKLIPMVFVIPFFIAVQIAVLILENSVHALLFQIVSNIVLVATGVWLIIRGIQSGISHYFFLGVAAVLVTALVRYFDLIGDYFGGAVLFMVFAMLLLGAARYWKSFNASRGFL